jgi:hypothetical protein
MKYIIKAFDFIVLINYLLTSDIKIKDWQVGKLKLNLKLINLNKEYIIDINKNNEIDIINFISIKDKWFNKHNIYEWKGYNMAKILNI